MKRQFVILGLLVTALNLAGQTKDPVIMKINGKDVKKSEFEYIYKKNNTDEVIDKKTLQEYVDLFRNFKLKVAEAESQGLDTTKSFIKELNEYRTQLAKPYLSDLPIDEELIKRAYERSGQYIEVSHIMLNVPPINENQNPYQFQAVLPADTFIVYKKADQIRKRLQKGESFENLVLEFSDDERSKSSTKPGFLGWATALQLPASLEDAMYNTPEGEISNPVRSAFGYHILKIGQKKQDPGQIRAAHILIMCPADADVVAVSDAENKIDSLYNLVVKGEDFAEIAKQHSEDKGSAVQGGDLSWFGYGMMVPEFQEVAFALENPGDISKPVRSQFGYHIIKLLDKKPAPSYDEKKKELISRLERGDRSYELRRPAIEKLKKENGFSPVEETYRKLISKAETVYPTDSAFTAAFENDKSVLFIAGNTPYTVENFITYLKTNRNSPHRESTSFVSERLQAFEYKTLQEEEDKSLENKYADFKNLMNEYRDGILLFEVSNNEVWDRASKDTEGLTAFFESNKDNYTWEQPHYKGYVVHCKYSKSVKKIKKEVSKLDADSAATYLINKYRNEESIDVKIEKGLFTQGDNSYVDELVFKSGKATPMTDFPETFVIGKLLQKPETYSDVRGLVITDYQNYLEEKWISELNNKYSVVIYDEVVNTIK